MVSQTARLCDSTRYIFNRRLCFFDCDNLKEITIPYGVISIGNYAFDGCDSIIKIVIPNSVTSIGKYAFCNSASLTSITIPNSVNSIGLDAFRGSTNLTIYGYQNSYAEQYAQKNGIPFKDISEFNDYYVESSELTVNYQQSGKADVNNLKMYETLQFTISLDCDKNQINGADILLRSYDDSIVKIIPKYDDFYDDTDIKVEGGCWIYSDDKTIGFDIPNSALFDYFKCNTTYYLDISNIKIDNKAIITSEQCKEKYSFKFGFSIKVGEQTFDFENVLNCFVAPGEKDGYHITKQMYDNEIKPYSIFKEHTVKKWLGKDSWKGSCFGMSSTMILSNTSRIENSIPGSYDIPKDTAAIPYGSRDIINYYHIIQDWYDMNLGASDLDSIRTIFHEALDIDSIDDIFEMSYYYYGKDNNNDKVTKFGHSVVVIGAESTEKGDFLYVYNPKNKYNTEKWPILISQIDGLIYTTLDGVKIFGIHWMYPFEINKFTPESIKNNTRIWTNIQNVSTIISNQVSNLIVFDDTSYEGSITPKDVRYTLYGEEKSEMLIVLPSENYYEISSDNGTIDYDIVNEDMFFVAKADSAEKTIVSADDGIKLISAVGNFELTVSADETMPYDMFDISGIANGDVDCRYVNNEVIVNLDNTSDTVITFYRDLETEDYTVPAEYDSFIIGKQNDEEAIFIDTDGDGTYETEILRNDVHIHTPASDYLSDETGHWYTCTKCNEKINFAAHTENDGITTVQPTATETGMKTYSCTVCGYVTRIETLPAIPPEHTHTFGTDWKFNNTSHWHECSCGEKSDIVAHTENSGVVTVQPTATTTGVRTYSCTVCGYVTRTESIPVTSPIDPTPVDPTPVNPTPSNPTPTYPNPIIPAPTYPEPGADILPPVLISNDNINISVSSKLTDLANGAASIQTRRRFFTKSAEVLLTNTYDSETAARSAMVLLDNDSLICYPFDISVYSTDNGSKMQLIRNGYIMFAIPVPKSMETNAASIEVYHIPDGVPEHIESEIITDEYGNLKIAFTANAFSPYMFTAVAGDDISSEAGVNANAVPIDFASPVSNGVTVPIARLPKMMKYSDKKRRYRILRKRRHDDLVFVY